MSCSINLEIFSPRWGHNDTYTIELSREEMKITMGARSTTCKFVENRDPKWEEKKLFTILSNDGITPPQKLEDLFEFVWMAWRNGELSDEDVNKELQRVAEWINVITKAKPKSEFWSVYF
ncbi:MAG: hypothetical protein M3P82_02595 [Bacteroidota bacterium]|nr:hypothetical protein [Bacteroidota bacterium]